MYPSTITTFSYPTASDRLNSPSHSALHNTTSSAIGQMQTVIGTSSSIIGTIIGDLRNPASDGGGHVQTAVKGGTGQTSFNKGDLLVATGPSVLSKLAVSSVTGNVLSIDTNEVTGMKWTAIGANKVAVTTNTSSIYNTTNQTAIFAASIVGSTLGTNNAIKFSGVLAPFWLNSGTFTVRAQYGVNSVFALTIPQPPNAIASVGGIVEGYIAGHSSVAVQKGFGRFIFGQGVESKGDANVGVNFGFITAYGVSSVNSSAHQDLVITGEFSGAAVNNSVMGQMFVVEKIV